MPPTPTTAREEAVAWLVERLRFEAVLSDLQRRYDETGEPVSFDTTEPAETEAAEAPVGTPARVAA
jgi:hypothetical protein